jgi:hypothetical protein
VNNVRDARAVHRNARLLRLCTVLPDTDEEPDEHTEQRGDLS